MILLFQFNIFVSSEISQTLSTQRVPLIISGSQRRKRKADDTSIVESSMLEWLKEERENDKKEWKIMQQRMEQEWQKKEDMYKERMAADQNVVKGMMSMMGQMLQVMSRMAGPNAGPGWPPISTWQDAATHNNQFADTRPPTPTYHKHSPSSTEQCSTSPCPSTSTQVSSNVQMP